MSSRAVMIWFYKFCPYPRDTHLYKQALRRVEQSDPAERNRLKAEFYEYDDGTIPVQHYSTDGVEWVATTNGPPQPQQNLKGIQQHGRKWRVERRIDGKLYRWTFDTLGEAIEKRDKVFSRVSLYSLAHQSDPDTL
jgi:hypothetical protein